MSPASSSPPQQAPVFEPPHSIAIEGPIRVGKSTLARILADRLHARRVFDPEDNPFLADFYREKPGSAFRAQMYFLIERHRRLSEAQQGDASGPVVSDFLFEKDKIFAYINLDNEELKLYERYFEMFHAALKAPDLVIYLQATPEVLRERIAKKKSPVERQIERLPRRSRPRLRPFLFPLLGVRPARHQHLGD